MDIGNLNEFLKKFSEEIDEDERFLDSLQVPEHWNTQPAISSNKSKNVESAPVPLTKEETKTAKKKITDKKKPVPKKTLGNSAGKISDVKKVKPARKRKHDLVETVFKEMQLLKEKKEEFERENRSIRPKPLNEHDIQIKMLLQGNMKTPKTEKNCDDDMKRPLSEEEITEDMSESEFKDALSLLHKQLHNFPLG